MKATLPILTVAATILVAGCSSVRNAREAQKDENRLPGERLVSFAETGLRAGEPVSLARLEHVALSNSPAVLQARQAVVLAQIAVRNVKASYIPTVDASVGYTLATANVNPDDQSGSMDGSFNGAANLNWLVYDFGRTRASTRQAVSALIAADRDLAAAEDAAVYAVRKACFALGRANELYAVARESAAAYDEHLRQMEERFKVGAVESYSVTKAGVDAANAELQVVTTSNTVQTCRAGLNYALGIAESPELVIAGSDIAAYDGLGADDLMAIARTNAPALASAIASAEGARYFVDKTVADLYPSLGVSIKFTASGEDSPFLWNLVGAGSAAQTIFCAGAKRRAIDAAVAQLRIARAKVADAELSLYNSLTTAVLDAQRARQQLEVAEKTVEMAKQNYDIVSQRYDVGDASELERTDAQVSLSSAKASAVSARYDYLDAQILISRLIGD